MTFVIKGNETIEIKEFVQYASNWQKLGPLVTATESLSWLTEKN